MSRLWMVLLSISFSLGFNSNQTWAEASEAQLEGSVCPVNMALNFEEHNAYIGFNLRLHHFLYKHYGKPSFQQNLNKALEDYWPTETVIEVGPTFLEKILNLIDQHYLKDAIASTIGLDHPDWYEFERTMKTVTLSEGITENKYGRFTKKVEKLIQSIKRVSSFDFKTPKLEKQQREVLKARAITRLANMTIFLERWDVINREITIQKGQAAGKQLLLMGVNLGATAVMVASFVYAGPIVASASAIGASFASDVVVAAQLARLGQVAAAAGMGAVGTPVSYIITDATFAILEAKKNSANNNSLYACELDKQMSEWKKRGAAPYIKGAILGGSVGLIGGGLTLTATGSKIVLMGTSFGIATAQLYAAGTFGHNTLKALAEYRMAIDAQEQGNNQAAREHLYRSRDYARKAGEKALETIIVAPLSHQVGTEFKAALHHGEDLIRVIFANASDTLPLALGIAKESLEALVNR